MGLQSLIWGFVPLRGLIGLSAGFCKGLYTVHNYLMVSLI